jgi:hypothetical protein
MLASGMVVALVAVGAAMLLLMFLLELLTGQRAARRR